MEKLQNLADEIERLKEENLHLRRKLNSKTAIIEKFKKKAQKETDTENRRKIFDQNKKSFFQKKSNNTKNPIQAPVENENDNIIKNIFVDTILNNLGESEYNFKYPQEVIDLCFAIYSISPHAYFVLREAIDLPCETTLKNYFSDLINSEKINLTDLSNVAEIIFNYRVSNNIDNGFDAILGIDACSFDRFTKDGKKFCFVFYVQPIDPDLKCFPVYIVPTIDGKANSSIIEIMENLIGILKDCDINIIMTSTDGDNGYNEINEKTFLSYVNEAMTEGFYRAIEKFGEFNGLKIIGDLLHCLKIARARLIIGNITLNNDSYENIINSEDLEELLNLGNTLTDTSPLGKMKDFYCLDLFKFQNLETLIENDKYNYTLYLIPYVCWAEAAVNNSLSRQTRLNLLEIAFNVLSTFLLQNNFIEKIKGITINNSKTSYAKIFADDVFLIRCLNSIVGLGYILLKYDNVGIDRVGTQVLENFFGLIRFSCQNYDSWERILSAVSHTVIRQRIFSHYNINIKIEKRVNTGGVKIYKSTEKSDDGFGNILKIANPLFAFNQIVKLPDELNACFEQLYNESKEVFLHLTSQSKNNTKKLFDSSSCKSNIMSRCLIKSEQILMKTEKERIEKSDYILAQAKQIYDHLNESEEKSESLTTDLNNIDQIITEFEKLNEVFKQRFKSLYINSKKNAFLLDLEQDETEIKAKAISTTAFNKSIKKFIESGVPDLLSSLYDEDSYIGDSYPFLYNVASILDNPLITSSKKWKKEFLSIIPPNNKLSPTFYSDYMTMKQC